MARLLRKVDAEALPHDFAAKVDTATSTIPV
jgi:hypothetical protein